MRSKFEIPVGLIENEIIVKGFEYDKSIECMFKVYNREIILNIGDKVDLLGYKIVYSKYLDIENDLMIYSLTRE